MGEMSVFASQYCEILAQTLNCTVCITDQDQVIVSSGYEKKEFSNKSISKEMERFLKKRENKTCEKGNVSYIPIVQGDEMACEEIICPILCEGDLIGSVILLNREKKKNLVRQNKKLLSVHPYFSESRWNSKRECLRYRHIRLVKRIKYKEI